MKNLDTTFITKKQFKKDIESFMNAPVPFSMTEIEGKYLSRVPAKNTYWGDLTFDLIVGGLIAITIVCVLAALFVFSRAEKAEASYLPRNNQEFCAEIEKWTVQGATDEEVSALCAKYL